MFTANERIKLIKGFMTMKGRLVALIVGVSFVLPGAVNAETVGDYIERSKKIEELEFTIEKLQRDLKAAELRYEIENVGKKKPEGVADPRLSEQQIQIQDYRIGNTPPSDEKEEDRPTYEELVERQKNRALDGAFVSSVFGYANGGEMTAELFLKNKGVVEVVKGDKVGNWKITNITLRATQAEHIKSGETIRLTSKGSSK